MARSIPRLYVVTDRQQTAGRPLEEVVAAAAQGGAGMIQLREKDFTARELYDLGRRLQDRLKPYGIPLLINDRLDVAQALDAAGVHLAGHSLAPSLARRVLGPDKLIGVSTHSLDHARQAMREGADFIVFGPVFDTPSKRQYGAPQGLQRLTDIVANITCPVIAIGGINTDNLPQVLQTGAHGVAMIRAVLAASDPGEAAWQLAQQLNTIS
ncbi:thiamine phosphate synthase [Candidatus Entotheonella palauensis]|nr:thiamine phosphate synthase [Candidatus Entotheonella palauensis]